MRPHCRPCKASASPGGAPEHRLPISGVWHWAEMARAEYTALLSHWPGASPGGVVKAPDGGCQSGTFLDSGQCASLDGGLFHEPQDQAVNRGRGLGGRLACVGGRLWSASRMGQKL